MKLFSILNKPVVKANNKQAGIVFLEYVIMAFIITVAVICALWWFYWHLQQMTWEIKQKLDTLKGLSCELSKPGEVQPKPGEGDLQSFSYQYTRSSTGDPIYWTSPPNEILYANQKITVRLESGPGGGMTTVVELYDNEGSNTGEPSWGDKSWPSQNFANVGDTKEYTWNHTGAGPYRVGLWGVRVGNTFSVTVTPWVP